MRSLNPVLVAMIPLAIGTSTGAMAETENLTCRAGASITAALAKLKPGDVLQVRGVCMENVVIPAHVSDRTLQGVNGAIVQGVDATQPVILIRGRAIEVSGFTVTGGLDGIEVNDGAFAWIDGNTIRLNSTVGISVVNNSTARIWNNVIENNSGGGVNVANNSSVLIGARTADDLVPSPNTIRNNSGGAGVSVQRSSTARVAGNTITGNGSRGILVARGSQADVAGNNISANTGDGIQAIHNSTIHLAFGGGIQAAPNSTEPGFPNAGYGVSCYGGGFITGRLGTLFGTSGTSNTAECSGGLAP
jgi:parallel beta-helix repeat protein